MAVDELIDSHVSTSQCKRAVDALLKHAISEQKKREESELLPGKEQHIWLVLAVKRMHAEKKLKPFKIPISYPLVDPRSSSICLIVKDPQREYKDLLEKHNIKFISRVVGIEKLKGKFKPFEARRLLLAENDLFLADERVVPLLPKLLGKRFFEAKKQPIPVSMTKKDLKAELERAISSTYMHQNQGTCTSIKIGRLSQTPAQVLANIRIALPAIAKRIPDSWNNIQSLSLKTSSSTSLPIWTCELGSDEAGGRWAIPVVKEATVTEPLSDVEVPESDEVSDDEEEEAPAPPPAKKGKKRAAEPEPEAKPAKKAKADKPSASAATASAPAVTQPSTANKGKKTRAKAAEVEAVKTKVTKAVEIEVAAPAVDAKSEKQKQVGTKAKAAVVKETTLAPAAKPTKKVQIASTATSGLTKSELAAKKDALSSAGGKKKEKVVSTKAKKSAKAGILGKK